MKATIPTITLLPGVQEKLELYTDLCPTEISGYGLVDLSPDGSEFIISEVFILEQTCSYAETQMDGGAIANFITDMATRGGDIARIRLQWHSHANMGTFWSADDRAVMNQHGADFMIYLVMNKKHEYLFKIDINQPFKLSFDEVPYTVRAVRDPHLSEEIKQEIDVKVKSSYAANAYNRKDYYGRPIRHYGLDDDDYYEGFYYGGRAYDPDYLRKDHKPEIKNNKETKNDQAKLFEEYVDRRCLNCGKHLLDTEKYFHTKACEREFFDDAKMAKEEVKEEVLDAFAETCWSSRKIVCGGDTFRKMYDRAVKKIENLEANKPNPMIESKKEVAWIAPK